MWPVAWVRLRREANRTDGRRRTPAPSGLERQAVGSPDRTGGRRALGLRVPAPYRRGHRTSAGQREQAGRHGYLYRLRPGLADGPSEDGDRVRPSSPTGLSSTFSPSCIRSAGRITPVERPPPPAGGCILLRRTALEERRWPCTNLGRCHRRLLARRAGQALRQQDLAGSFRAGVQREALRIDRPGLGHGRQDRLHPAAPQPGRACGDGGRNGPSYTPSHPWPPPRPCT